MDESTPAVLQAVATAWEVLASKTEESGYYTFRAGFYFIFSSKLWFLFAPYDREGQYTPHIDTIGHALIGAGATDVVFDAGELN